MRRLAGLASIACAMTVAAQPQEIPRFKGGVDVVQFTVTVLDKERRPITGLTPADFEVLVDGQPRPLAAFAAVTLPDDTLTLAESLPSVPIDVQTNRLPLEGRLVIIVMDRSITNGQPMQVARAVANAAIDRLGPADVGGVVFTSSASRRESQGLTTDRARLRAAVDQTHVGALEEPPLPPTLAAAAATRGATQPNQPLNRVQLASNELSGECNCGVCVTDALTALAKTLTGGTARHKSILFIGSDIALATEDQRSYCAAFVYPARERLSRALDEANVTLNVVDPRGLEYLGDTAELDRSPGRIEQGTNLFRQSSLAILPDYTGGRLVVNSNKPERAIGPIFDEDRAYYVLAIARDPVTSKAEDRHRIKIAVKRSDVTVRTRNLYFGADPKPAPKATNAAASALAELLPRADFPLQMNLASQFSPDGSAEIRVLLGVNSGAAGKLDVLIRAYDRVFTPVGTPVKQRLDVPPGAVAGSSAFQWTSVLKLPPGDFEVRAAVATADGTRAASVIGYIDVPDTRKTDLALSGVILKSGAQPTLRRVFAAGESIAASFQVARAKAADVSVGYRLTNILGQALADGVLPRAASGTGPIEPHEFQVRMPNVAGQYVLMITATAGQHSTHRDLPLTVR